MASEVEEAAIPALIAALSQAGAVFGGKRHLFDDIVGIVQVSWYAAQR
jgi:hypothetical protein